MNGAQFRSLRESLGLPVSWIARVSGVAERQVRRWENDDSPIKDEALLLLVQMEGDAGQTRAALEQNVRENPDVPLYAYRDDEELWRDHKSYAKERIPATYYRAILQRVAESKAVPIYYIPTPVRIDNGEQQRAAKLRGRNFEKYYPAEMLDGPFERKELMIGFEPPHPRRPFGRLPFFLRDGLDEVLIYELVPGSTALSPNGLDVLASKYRLVVSAT
jgi:transcriptional regulator with XRE-family HTH domain